MQAFENIVFEVAFIFAGAAVIATLFLYLRQPIILAYVVLGMLAGPWGLGVIPEAEHIEHISHLGIILLMFLLGLNLHASKLYKLLRQTALVTAGTSLVFTLLAMLVALAFGFSWVDSLIVGLALMFSSTVVCLKLIPTVTLHHRHMGEVMISVLLLQDILAIVLILFLYGSNTTSIHLEVVLLLVKAAGLAVCAFLVVTYLLVRILQRFDVIQDYLSLVALGWCMLVAAIAQGLGLSYEIGAFMAGIALATSPVSLVISEGLKPLREFFLTLFFFSIGAQFDFFVTKEVLLPGLVLAAVLLAAKPVAFYYAFRLTGESASASKELGLRLGQASEFSLLVAFVASSAGRIEETTAYLIQLAAILTFIISTYLVVYKYPTPIAASESMRQH